MKVKCKFCDAIHEAEEWNKRIEFQCGKGITKIEEGVNNNNWMYICPSCNTWCYKMDREIVE